MLYLHNCKVLNLLYKHLAVLFLYLRDNELQYLPLLMQLDTSDLISTITPIFYSLSILFKCKNIEKSAKNPKYFVLHLIIFTNKKTKTSTCFQKFSTKNDIFLLVKIFTPFSNQIFIILFRWHTFISSNFC